jgi:hypothetical protein
VAVDSWVQSRVSCQRPLVLSCRYDDVTQMRMVNNNTPWLLCKICGAHGGDLKNVVFWDIKTQFVPHEIHNVTATEHSLIMQCKISGVHGGD